MKRLVSISAGLVAAGAVLVIALSAGSSSKAHTTANARPAAAALAVKSTSLGNILVGAHGRTLYLFKADRPNASTLSSAGLAAWPAFRASVTPQARGGVSAGLAEPACDLLAVAEEKRGRASTRVYVSWTRSRGFSGTSNRSAGLDASLGPTLPTQSA